MCFSGEYHKYRFISLLMWLPLQDLPKANVVTANGMARMKCEHWTKYGNRVALQSWPWVEVKLIIW